jgi:hypothetical protein
MQTPSALFEVPKRPRISEIVLGSNQLNILTKVWMFGIDNEF